MKALFNRLRRQYNSMSQLRQRLVVGELVLWTLFLPIGFGISWLLAIVLVAIYYPMGITLLRGAW